MENRLYVISELEADEIITHIKELEADKKRFETIANGKIQIIQSTLEIRVNNINNEVQFAKDQLRHFFNTVESKETKTQKSYSLLSGKLIYKKPTVKIAHDDKKILEWAEATAREYVKSTITLKLDYAELKKDLVISSGSIVNKATGEVLEVEGLTIEEVKESFEVK